MNSGVTSTDASSVVLREDRLAATEMPWFGLKSVGGRMSTEVTEMIEMIEMIDVEIGGPTGGCDDSDV